jgi:hypothetical protein
VNDCPDFSPAKRAAILAMIEASID